MWEDIQGGGAGAGSEGGGMYAQMQGICTHVDGNQFAHDQNVDFLGHSFRVVCTYPGGALVRTENIL